MLRDTGTSLVRALPAMATRRERVTADLRHWRSHSLVLPAKSPQAGATVSLRNRPRNRLRRWNARRPGAVVDLHGEKDAQLLKWFPLNHSYACKYPGGREDTFLKVVDMPAYFKSKRPSLDESSSYLFGWLAGYFAADGCVASDGTVILDSAHADDLEFVRTVALRLGVGTYGITTQQRVGIGATTQPRCTGSTSSTRTSSRISS